MNEMQDAPPVLLRGSHGNRMLLALGQKERGTLGALLASGKIGSAELLAANRWYEIFVMAEYGAVDTDKSGKGGRVRLYAQERQVAAMTSYRLTRIALGPSGDRRLRAILSDGVSMAELARSLKLNPHVVSGMVAADLIRLVEHYTAGDRPGGRTPG